MAKKMLIDATHAEETRVVVVDGNKVDEFDFETANRRQLAGNIYLAKVTRVEPSLQAAFVDYGGNRHGFLAFSEIHPDYYQIPVADRQALMEEERALADAEEEPREKPRRAPRGRKRAQAEAAASADPANGAEIPGMAVLDPAVDEADGAADAVTTPDAGEPDAGPRAEDAAAATPQGGAGEEAENGAKPYAAVDHATELDSDIESVADEDVSEEIRSARKPRPRRYKIQEVIKVRQILLVQVVKEERGNKGAALTTYLSLAGRYCVLMPNTARGGGISRKITNAADRKKLKDIAGSLIVPEGAGLIIRTAGAQRTKAEIKRDYEYLMRLWEQIRELTLKSIAPAPIYEEGDLIKRAIRDLYNREIDEVLVEGADGYRVAKDFMKMIMPSHARHVKHYQDSLPLFARYQVESYLSSMFNPTVQLPSGGYLVIGVTEALVAIDINSGRATKEGSIEDTALKTNLEAADEIARQLRLRDLAGLIVIDFIDMEERKNNAAVEKRFKERLKTDRARIQVGRISGFGLLEMSRQRLRPGMIEATTQPCPHCHGTGILRSDDNLALSIIRQLEEEGTRQRSGEVLLTAPIGIVNFLMNAKREHIAQIEARYGMAVRIEADPSLTSPDFKIEKFRTATRPVSAAAPIVSVDSTAVAEPAEAEESAAPDVATPSEPARADTDAQPAGPKKKRRRRRRRKGNGGDDATGAGEAAQDRQAQDDAQQEDAAAPSAGSDTQEAPATEDAAAVPVGDQTVAQPAEQGEQAGNTDRKPARKRRSRRKPAAEADATAAPAPAEPDPTTGAVAASETIDAQPQESAAPAATAVTSEPDTEASTEPAPKKPRARRRPARKSAPEPEGAATAGNDAAAQETLPAETSPAEATPAEDPSATAPAAERSEETADAIPPAPADEAEAKAGADATAEPVQSEAEQEKTDAPAAEKPRRRRGWWALGR